MSKLVSSFFIILVLLTGCSDASFQTNKDPSYESSLKILGVLENSEFVGLNYVGNFNSHFTQTLKSCGILVFFDGEPTLDSGSVEKLSAKTPPGASPDSILTIALTSYNSRGLFNYELTLRDKSRKKVWKALMKFIVGPRLSPEYKGQAMSDDLIGQMTNDGLIGGCSPSAKPE